MKLLATKTKIKIGLFLLAVIFIVYLFNLIPEVEANITALQLEQDLSINQQQQKAALQNNIENKERLIGEKGLTAISRESLQEIILGKILAREIYVLEEKVEELFPGEITLSLKGTLLDLIKSFFYDFIALEGFLKIAELKLVPDTEGSYILNIAYTIADTLYLPEDFEYDKIIKHKDKIGLEEEIADLLLKRFSTAGKNQPLAPVDLKTEDLSDNTVMTYENIANYPSENSSKNIMSVKKELPVLAELPENIVWRGYVSGQKRELFIIETPAKTLTLEVEKEKDLSSIKIREEKMALFKLEDKIILKLDNDLYKIHGRK